MSVPKENLSISLPPKVRSQVDRAAKRGKRSRSEVVRDALQLYFKLHGIACEEPTADERKAIAEGERAYERGAFVSLEEWQHAVGLGDH
jgi:metal-responsive CopG/Arc/MetJ family transcriptional regulator